MHPLMKLQAGRDRHGDLEIGGAAEVEEAEVTVVDVGREAVEEGSSTGVRISLHKQR